MKIENPQNRNILLNMSQRNANFNLIYPNFRIQRLFSRVCASADAVRAEKTVKKKIKNMEPILGHKWKKQ
jgi:hypothetical protein